MEITESKITLDCPGGFFFRFEDCPGYKKVQNNLAEMDVCWYDEQQDILYLVELKDWGDNSLVEEKDPKYSQAEIDKMKKGISDYRIYNLVKKSVGSTCMIASILLKTPSGIEIDNCSKFTITTNTQLKLFSIINWTDKDVTYISSVNSTYRTKFSSYAKLFNVKTYLVLTYETAKKEFDWVK